MIVFSFDKYKTKVLIECEIPSIDKIFSNSDTGSGNHLIIADENTKSIAEKVCGAAKASLCIIKSGETNKNWQSVEAILSAAVKAKLGRDSAMIGIGGGVICDLAGFAASIYMRGCRLILIPTTLLAMVDASVGGKTGFDIFGMKNLAGSFYPAELVYMSFACLSSLPQREWKNGAAEIIKTAIPDYYNIIRPEIDDISNAITKLRMNKAHEEIDDIDKYIQLIEQSIEYVYQIRKAKGSLLELKHKHFLKNPLIGYIVAVLTLLLMILLRFI